MNDCKRGDVVLVPYQLSADGEPVLRPALVVSTETYQQGRRQLMLAAVTSNRQPPQLGDTVVGGWQEAGLVGPSLVTGVLLTVTPEEIDRTLGSLAVDDLRAVESSLRLNLGV